MNSQLLERTHCSMYPELRSNERAGSDRAAPVNGQFTIRPCQNTKELDQCIALQQQAWGYPDREVVPRNIYVLAQALGGHVLAAWDRQGELAGFAMAMAAHEPASMNDHRAVSDHWMISPSMSAQGVTGATALTAPQLPPKPYLHSHMLAVSPRYQNQGLGLALKLAQRDDARARGIDRMRWTFDPLVAKNAYFNLHRLGATASRYLPDFYGQLDSALQGGLPSDRLLAEWDLTRKQPMDTIQARDRQEPEAAQPSSNAAEATLREEFLLRSEITRWRTTGATAELAAAQQDLRGRLQGAFRRGLILHDFARDVEGGGLYRLRGAS